MEDRLPRDPAARVQQVHAVGPEPLLHAPGQLPRHPCARLEVLVREVAARGGIDVHEGDGALVLVHARGRDLAGDDLAEQAVRIHPRKIRGQTLNNSRARAIASSRVEMSPA